MTTLKQIAIAVLSTAALAIGIVSLGSAQQSEKKPQGGATIQTGDPLAIFRHPKNLKVLPKRISAEELQQTMHNFSRSLGVRCGFCHVAKPAVAGEKPEMDFVSDAKDEKVNSRKMFTMTKSINTKYLHKIDKSFQIDCVSCHRGSPKPMLSVDSLPKAQPATPRTP